MAELRAIDEALAVLIVPQDEWEVLYRERLQVERDLLAGDRPGQGFPGDAPRGPADAPGRGSYRPGVRLPAWISSALAGLGFTLAALDIVVALVDRRRGA
jgi:hypothetical protein